MKPLLIAFLLAFVGASFAHGQAGKGIDAATVAAYEKIGAEYGGWVKSEQGPVFQPGRAKAESGLPGFRFRTFPKETMPPVTVPFGLDLSGSNVTDTNLKELA